MDHRFPCIWRTSLHAARDRKSPERRAIGCRVARRGNTFRGDWRPPGESRSAASRATTPKPPLSSTAPAKSIETAIDAGVEDQDNDDYPDLIEDDARTMRSSFIGKLWDGSKFLDVDVELRAAASHPHLSQSVFQFILIDRSPQRLTLNWDLPVSLAKTMEPYYTGGGEGVRHQDIYVFFGKKRPAPARGVVEVRTSGGKVLARFTAFGFVPEEDGATKKQ